MLLIVVTSLLFDSIDPEVGPRFPGNGNRVLPGVLRGRGSLR